MSEEEQINPEDYKDFKESLEKKQNAEDDPGDVFDSKIKQIQDGDSTAPYSVSDLLDDTKPLSDNTVESTPVENKKEKIEVPKDKTFEESPGSVDSIMREVMVDPESVDVTESDKRDYIKAVLNDVPVKLTMTMCGGNIKAVIRSRTSWEQTCIYAALQKDQDDGIVKDLASVVIQLQKYGACLMVESVNDKGFSREHIPEDVSIEDAVKKLRELRKSKIEPMSTPKWSIILNALRCFEGKLSRMGTQCLNENFWEPAG